MKKPPTWTKTRGRVRGLAVVDTAQGVAHQEPLQEHDPGAGAERGVGLFEGTPILVVSKEHQRTTTSFVLAEGGGSSNKGPRNLAYPVWGSAGETSWETAPVSSSDLWFYDGNHLFKWAQPQPHSNNVGLYQY